MRRHINEFRKTGFANSGRAAGMGILYDKYGEESGLENYERGYNPILIAEREEQAARGAEGGPVTTYRISKEEAEKL